MRRRKRKKKREGRAERKQEIEEEVQAEEGEVGVENQRMKDAAPKISPLRQDDGGKRRGSRGAVRNVGNVFKSFLTAWACAVRGLAYFEGKSTEPDRITRPKPN